VRGDKEEHAVEFLLLVQCAKPHFAIAHRMVDLLISVVHDAGSPRQSARHTPNRVPGPVFSTALGRHFSETAAPGAGEQSVACVAHVVSAAGV